MKKIIDPLSDLGSTPSRKRNQKLLTERLKYLPKIIIGLLILIMAQSCISKSKSEFNSDLNDTPLKLGTPLTGEFCIYENKLYGLAKTPSQDTETYALICWNLQKT